VIVWDSREAEERNARQRLTERTRDVARCRRNLRANTWCRNRLAETGVISDCGCGTHIGEVKP
jgi:hypothetical protein